MAQVDWRDVGFLSEHHQDPLRPPQEYIDAYGRDHDFYWEHLSPETIQKAKYRGWELVPAIKGKGDENGHVRFMTLILMYRPKWVSEKVRAKEMERIRSIEEDTVGASGRPDNLPQTEHLPPVMKRQKGGVAPD